MRSPKIVITLIFLLSVFLLVHAVQARQDTIDYERMTKDLRIMEGVLNATLSDDADGSFLLQAFRTKGAYIEGYGVVFMSPPSSRGRIVVTSSDKSVSIGGLWGIHVKDDSLTIEDTEQLREKITGFLGSYTGLIKQVKQEDWITVIIYPFASPLRLTFESEHETTQYWLSESGRRGILINKREYNPLLIVSVKKEDVTRYREDKINYDQFKQTVSFSETGEGTQTASTAEMQKDIDVLRGIIESVIEDNYKTTLRSNSIQGTYLNDFGVLFTVSAGNAAAYRDIDVIRRDLYDNYFKSMNRSLDEMDMERIIQESLEQASSRLEDLEISFDLAETNYEISQERFNIGDVTEEMLEIARHRAEEFRDAVDEERILFEKHLRDLYSVDASEREYLLTEFDEEDMEKLRDVLTDVLADYGNTIRGLQPDERIAIFFATNGSRSKSLDVKSNLMLIAQLKDIDAVNNGSISLDEFKKRITSRIFE